MHTVLHNLDIGIELSTYENLYSLKSFLLALPCVTSFVYPTYSYSIRLQNHLQVIYYLFLEALYTKRESLDHKHILILIHDNSRQKIRFTEYNAAG